MTLPIIVIGSGGHARVLISVLKTLNSDFLGITDFAPEKIDSEICGIPVLGNDDRILDYSPDAIMLVNGIGSISSTEKRKDIYVKFKNDSYSFASVVHPLAIIMNDVQLGEGVQIMAGAIIQTGCVIGNNAIINTGAIVDHDCIIGEHTHVSPGAVLSGGVHIGAMTHIGTSATVIQGVKIGREAIIGAGAVVIADIPSEVKVTGVPARIIKRKES
jgi:sugar O-acyltransferase (sialic acid O-acetyltransferase NeuD family)